MPVEHVQQRAGEEQREGQILHHVRAVLGEQKIPGDQDESQEYPATRPAAAQAGLFRDAPESQR